MKGEFFDLDLNSVALEISQLIDSSTIVRFARD
jgi:hypothetical protein